MIRFVVAEAPYLEKPLHIVNYTQLYLCEVRNVHKYVKWKIFLVKLVCFFGNNNGVS